MLKKRLMLAIPAILITLSSCASLTITTWLIQQDGLVHGPDQKTLAEAQGYRCYSEADDTAWRTELKIQTACCGGQAQ